MRLYSRTGAIALDDPDHGHYDAGPNGEFDLPDDLSDRLHRVHVRGLPEWETDIERQNRLIREELERRKDPATLLDAVQQLVAAAQATAPTPAKSERAEPKPQPEPKSTPAKPTRTRKAATPE